MDCMPVIYGNQEGNVMKRLLRALQWTGVLAVVFCAAQVHAGEQQAITSEADKASYVTGVNIVRTLMQQGCALNLDLVMKGMMDGLTGDKLLLTEKEVRKTMSALKNELKQKQAIRVVEYADHYEAIGMGDASAAARSQVDEQTPDQERTSAALLAATISGNALQAAAVSSQAPAQEQVTVPLVPEQTFEALLAAQEQANADGDAPIVVSDLMRRHGESWLKTQHR